MHTKQRFEIGTTIEYRDIAYTASTKRKRKSEWERGTLVYQSKEHLVLEIAKDGRETEIVLNIHDYDIREYVSPQDKLAEMVEWALRESEYALDMPGSVCRGLSRDIAENLVSGYDLKV